MNVVSYEFLRMRIDMRPEADPEILTGQSDNVSAPSSFIANAHNEPYSFFYTVKGGLLKQKF